PFRTFQRQISSIALCTFRRLSQHNSKSSFWPPCRKSEVSSAGNSVFLGKKCLTLLLKRLISYRSNYVPGSQRLDALPRVTGESSFVLSARHEFHIRHNNPFPSNYIHTRPSYRGS